MLSNVKAAEKIAILGRINPQTVASTELFTDIIDMSQFHQAVGIAALGDMAAETGDFTLYTCTDSSGGGATKLKGITQLTASASVNDNTQYKLNVRAEELLPTSTRYIKFGLKTGASVGGPACVIALGVDGRFGAESASDLSTVAQVVL